MKRIIAILLASAMLFILCACKQQVPMEDFVPSNFTDAIMPIMETESGYYYALRGGYILKYYDKQSGNTIFCCNKPECAHDGNPYCAATSNEYSMHFAAEYGNAIYISAVKYVGEEQDAEFKLLRVEPDGTSLSEVCTYLTLKNAGVAHSTLNNGLLLHRGKAFVYYNYVYRDENGNFGDDMTTGIMIIDLATGNYHELPTDMYDAENVFLGQRCTRADGDWFYYIIQYLGSKNDECEMYRYNTETEVTEKVDVPITFSSYTVHDGFVYYTVADREKKEVTIYKHSPDTGETVEFSDKPMPAERIMESSIVGHQNNQPEITTDGKYFYYSDFGFDSSLSNKPDSPYNVVPKCTILDADGNQIASFDFPTDPTADPEHNFYSIAVNIVNDTVYAQYHEKVICCPLENILAGNVEWQELYVRSYR